MFMYGDAWFCASYPFSDPGNDEYICSLTWSNTTVSWYFSYKSGYQTSFAHHQLNHKDRVYTWLAIG